VTFNGYLVPLVLLLGFASMGFIFSFHYWRYDPIKVTSEFRLAIPSERALGLSLEALSAAKVRHLKTSSEKASLCGHTGLSVRSLGTRCRIDITALEHGCEVKCACWPRAELVLTDWGAGRATLQAIIGHLAGNSPAIPI
jgi:hypothetical protein